MVNYPGYMQDLVWPSGAAANARAELDGAITAITSGMADRAGRVDTGIAGWSGATRGRFVASDGQVEGIADEVVVQLRASWDAIGTSQDLVVAENVRRARLRADYRDYLDSLEED